MRKSVDRIKWLSSSLLVVSLLMVFWVWPAWNSGSQTWYWGNGGDTISEMYRNRHAPPDTEPLRIDPGAGGGMIPEFSHFFEANEPANQMVAFDDSPWKYHIEWYGAGKSVMGAPDFRYSLNIGRWSNMNMTMMWSYTPFFEAMGDSMGPGSSGLPIVIEGDTVMTMMSMMLPFTFLPGDILGAMIMITNNTSGEITVPLTRTCYITSPLTDPGYPGFLPPIPSLSRWGMLALAVLVAFFSITVIRRRLRTGKS